MLYILLPAYNEEKSLHDLLPKINESMKSWKNMDFHIIVCDDGSTDKTNEILMEYQKKLPMTIILHKYNRGLGETSRDMFEKAAEISSAGDFIIRMDCDNTHEPLYMMKMVEMIKQGFDVVIASRFEPGGGQKGLSSYRKIISRLANIFMKIFFPIRDVKEYSCGFRAYRAELIKHALKVYGNNFIQLKGIGFTCTLEKLIKLNLVGARFAEIPFVLKYNQKKSPSKMVTSITTFGYFTLVIMYRWPWGGWKSLYKKIERFKPGSCAE